MRVPRQLVWSVLASLLLVGSAPAAVQADETRAHHGAHCPFTHRVRGTNGAPTARQVYYRGDWRLGPQGLPTTGPIGRMLRNYQRLDAMPQRWFLLCYWQTNVRTQLAGWWYPDNSGFVRRNERPVERPVTLPVGKLVDLFGSGAGNFLAPAGTPFEQRALPPSNLDTYDPTFPFSYHLYRVTKAFTVEAGPARPWFGQPGLGVQYATVRTVKELKTDHFLTELTGT